MSTEDDTNDEGLQVNDSGWSAYEKLVMHELSTLKEELEEVKEGVTLLRIDVAQLKVKAGIWGAAAGMIPALITSLTVLVAGAG